MDTKILSFEHLPDKRELALKSELQEDTEFLVIYDQVLNQYNHFRNWLKQFSLNYPVEAGENLKAVELFPDHINFLIEKLINIPPKKTCILCVGGGTVGDFGGFVASIFKRGVSLVHLPTTWLAALDSAHGGKNALNVGHIKNQIGTIYPAKSVVLARDMLVGLGQEQCLSALGELIKISIIDGKSMLNYIHFNEDPIEELLWDLLHKAIKAKMKIVKKDPYEEKGMRQKLNLGHTLGHALETQFRIPHGLAVAQGIYFAAEWSLAAEILNKADYEMIIGTLDRFYSKQKSPRGDFIGNFRVIDLKRLVAQDKKVVDESRVNFIFIERIGRVEVVKVALNNLIRQAVKQGWAV